MAQLARRHPERTITRLDELAQREDVSSSFLVQILNDLRRGGLIQSKRGKAGGYLLAREPETVSLLDIVEAVEPALLVNSTTGNGESGEGVRRAWEGIAVSTREQLASIPLKHLTAGGDAPMYYI